jgi:hypothetical protein
VAYEVVDERGELAITIECLRTIEVGEELLLDYGLDIGTQSPEAFACGCGASACRGTLAALPTDAL